MSPTEDRPRPICGTTAAGCAAVALLLPPLLPGLVVVLLLTVAEPDHGGGLGILGAAVVGVYGAGLAAFVGVLAGIAAFDRGERHRWRAVAGLLCCGGVLATLVGLFLRGRLG